MMQWVAGGLENLSPCLSFKDYYSPVPSVENEAKNSFGFVSLLRHAQEVLGLRHILFPVLAEGILCGQGTDLLFLPDVNNFYFVNVCICLLFLYHLDFQLGLAGMWTS